MRMALQIGGVFLWALFFFALVFYVSFPSRAVSERIALEAQERLSLAVDVDKPKPKGLTGVRFKSLGVGRITGDDEPQPLLSMGRTWIKIRPLAALRGNYDVRFDGVVYEGHARGNVKYSETEIVADVDLDELEVRSWPLRGETWSIDGAGTFDSEIDLNLDQEDITMSEGEVSFSFDGRGFREGSQIYGMDFETVFDEAGGLITVADGRATIEWARFKGDKIEAEITGYISLKEDLQKSRLALKIQFKLVDETLEQLLALRMGDNPAHRDGRGNYHYTVIGSLDNPRPREDRAGARRSNRGRSRTEDRDDDDAGDRPPARSNRVDEMSDEERAEWEKQREERREQLRKKREERRGEVEGRRDESSRSRARADGTFSDDIQTGSSVRRRAPSDEDEVDEELDEEDLDEEEDDDFDEDEDEEGEEDLPVDSAGEPMEEF